METKTKKNKNETASGAQTRDPGESPSWADLGAAVAISISVQSEATAAADTSKRLHEINNRLAGPRREGEKENIRVQSTSLLRGQFPQGSPHEEESAFLGAKLFFLNNFDSILLLFPRSRQVSSLLYKYIYRERER